MLIENIMHFGMRVFQSLKQKHLGNQIMLEFPTLGHTLFFFSFCNLSMTSHFTQIEVRGKEGNRGSTSDLQGKMTSEIMVQIVPLLRTKRGKEHQ